MVLDMKKYKNILASDFDGTLFIDKKLKENDIRAIKDFQNENCLFGIATGRSFAYLKEDLKDYIKCDFYVLSNGALILVKEDDDLKEIFRRTLKSSEVREIIEFYKNNSQVDKIKIFTKDTSYDISDDFISDDNVLSIGLYINSEIRKYKEDKFSYHPSIGVYDITTKNINKQMGIDIIKEYYEFQKDIYAIGDDLNDLEFLEGTSLSYTLDHVKDKRVSKAASFRVKSIGDLIDEIRRV